MDRHLTPEPARSARPAFRFVAPRLFAVGLVAVAASLAACDRSPPMPDPEVAVTPADDAGAVPAVPAERDVSVPDAATALPPGEALPPSTEDQAPGTRTPEDGTMSDREEATEMPLPGQANDHSAPTDSAKSPGS